MTDTQQNRAPSTGQTSRPAAPAAVHHGHGNSVAAWVAVSVVMFAALLMSIAVVVVSVWLFVIGAVIAVIGAFSGKVLAGMGFGVHSQSGPAEH